MRASSNHAVAPPFASRRARTTGFKIRECASVRAKSERAGRWASKTAFSNSIETRPSASQTRPIVRPYFPTPAEPTVLCSLGRQAPLRRCRANTLASYEPATETAERPARNDRDYDSDIWTSLNIRYSSLINVTPAIAFVSSQAVSALPTGRSDHQNPGQSPPGHTRRQPGPGAGPRRPSGLSRTRRRQRQKKVSTAVLHPISPPNEKARRPM